MAAVLPLSSSIGARLSAVARDTFSTVVVASFVVFFLTRVSGHYRALYSASWRPVFGDWASPFVLTTPKLLWWLVACYLVCLPFYYWVRSGIPSKSYLVLRHLVESLLARRWFRVSDAERQAYLSVALKSLFLPFCLNGLVGHLAGLNNQFLSLDVALSPGASFDLSVLYNRHLHFLLLNLILIFDFVPFVLGYLVESRRAGNEIVTVESSLLGWVVCLACYPPFNGVVGAFVSWKTSDSVPVGAVVSDDVRALLNVCVLLCFVVFVWASLSLGLKSSNLTNRGVVARGAYRFVRHPAYMAKNLAWWLAGLPVLVGLFSSSILSGCIGVFSLSVWTGLYAARALTEERHMLRVDTGYRAYMSRVRYRFIPGVV